MLTFKRNVNLRVRGPDGKIKHHAHRVWNNETDEGLLDMVTQFFTGVNYQKSWYIGLGAGPFTGEIISASTAAGISVFLTPIGDNPWQETIYPGREIVDFSDPAQDDSVSFVTKTGPPAAGILIFPIFSEAAFSFMANNGTSGANTGPDDVLVGMFGASHISPPPVGESGDTIELNGVCTIEVE